VPHFLAKVSSFSKTLSFHWLIVKMFEKAPEWLGPAISAITLVLVVVDALLRKRQPLHPSKSQPTDPSHPHSVLVLHESTGDIEVKFDGFSVVAKVSEAKAKRETTSTKLQKNSGRKRNSK
jgi:hypothetical protein